MKIWNDVVAKGASGAAVIAFVHEEEVVNDTITWQYQTVVYVLRYPGGSYAQGVDTFPIMYGRLEQFELDWAGGHVLMDDAKPAQEFIGKDGWPVAASLPVAPQVPIDGAVMARHKGPKL